MSRGALLTRVVAVIFLLAVLGLAGFHFACHRAPIPRKSFLSPHPLTHLPPDDGPPAFDNELIA